MSDQRPSGSGWRCKEDIEADFRRITGDDKKMIIFRNIPEPEEPPVEENFGEFGEPNTDYILRNLERLRGPGTNEHLMFPQAPTVPKIDLVKRRKELDEDLIKKVEEEKNAKIQREKAAAEAEKGRKSQVLQDEKKKSKRKSLLERNVLLTRLIRESNAQSEQTKDDTSGDTMKKSNRRHPIGDATVDLNQVVDKLNDIYSEPDPDFYTRLLESTRITTYEAPKTNNFVYPSVQSSYENGPGSSYRFVSSKRDTQPPPLDDTNFPALGEK